MKNQNLIIGLLSLIFVLVIQSCSSETKTQEPDPTMCECQKELYRLLEINANTGNIQTSDLSDKCDRIYPNVSYLDGCNE